ncbi:hypothetical protein IX321_002348 [Bacteroides pyogenes]|nr:hypothetical protein [Bacteroides pyogenes]MBR8718383.1 hypothetical protein [Bacteroides pyogenes]MBR8747871.1 hypothetical protein [Bacteroides pyogenes]MBR8758177.1 hypothetical protein [Bacteroides pyogenes]MBR8781403.1 hypothetical protein [Bacteroides pyogenes]
MYRKHFEGNRPVGRDRFEYILDKYNLKVRKKKRKPRTTDSRHGLPTYPNQAKSYIPTQANRLWVSDIIYIPIHVNESKHIFCYLSLILDAYSKEIVGWAVGETLETGHCIQALRMALKRVDDTSGKELIHHSERGCQYASKEYTSLLREYGITISMTEDGNPKDNAQAERINNTMKNELLKGKSFCDIKEVTEAVEKAVLFYNTERPHMSINMMTPQEAATHTGEIKKGWTSYRDIAIKNLQTENIISNKCLSLGA